MSDREPISFVAAIGGFYGVRDEEAVASAQKAAEQLGAAFARAGLGLVVYFSNPLSLEPHVVRGYVAAGGKGPKSIRVRCTEEQNKAVMFAEESANPELFDRLVFPGSDWEAPFYRSLAQQEGVDAVLLLSGGSSTLIAGHIAVARGLPLLAVPHFGGSAQKIWAVVAATNLQGASVGWQPASDDSLVAELKSKCEQAERVRRESRRRARLQEFLSAKRTAAATCAMAFVALLAAFAYTIARDPDPGWFGLVSFVGLICAGATGALARTVLSTNERDVLIVLTLGAVAGFVVGLAYLIPQLITSHGFLDPTKQAIVPTDKIAIASALLVAISAGVGFDAVFRRLQKQADEVPISPTSQ